MTSCACGGDAVCFSALVFDDAELLSDLHLNASLIWSQTGMGEFLCWQVFVFPHCGSLKYAMVLNIYHIHVQHMGC